MISSDSEDNTKDTKTELKTTRNNSFWNGHFNWKVVVLTALQNDHPRHQQGAQNWKTVIPNGSEDPTKDTKTEILEWLFSLEGGRFDCPSKRPPPTPTGSPKLEHYDLKWQRGPCKKY